MKNIENRSVDALRVLSADAIQKAKSGHPGMPLGCAPMAYQLWGHHMRFDPTHPDWINRDRFVLSAGHGSALLYSLLHLLGFGLTVDDMKSFRQLGSLTPGHPEYGYTAGVDATTGPLGAGLGMAVGMAMAETHLAEVFNKPDHALFDHYTYAICGDGCLMEGISSEALSLAGTLGLSKLIILYDSNNITIEGSTDLAFTEDVSARIASFGFQTLTVEDGTDLDAINAAIEQAKADTERPSFITIKTMIGYGCPAKQGSASSHGEPLGEENVAALRTTLGWEHEEAFFIPDDIRAHFADLAAKSAASYGEWQAMADDYFAKYPEMKEKFDLYMSDAVAPESLWDYEPKDEATRVISGDMLNIIAEGMPNLMGGSADLAPSNKTVLKNKGEYSRDNRGGRNIHFGVREMAMAAIGNGLLLHGGLRSFVSTFFVFSDYVKPMTRLSAIMHIPSIYIFSHDSIGVGEDGCTHEPVEQLAMLRSTPNFNIWRPCNSNETAAAWKSLIESRTTPGALILSRQKIRSVQSADEMTAPLRGGYIISPEKGETPDAVIIATGSEVPLAADAQAMLAEKGIDVRVVSMPCREVFDAQDEAYREKVLPKSVRARVAVEAGTTFGWGDIVGINGAVVGMTTFGLSANFNDLFPHFGFTAENVAATVEKVVADLK